MCPQWRTTFKGFETEESKPKWPAAKDVGNSSSAISGISKGFYKVMCYDHIKKNMSIWDFIMKCPANNYNFNIMLRLMGF